MKIFAIVIVIVAISLHGTLQQSVEELLELAKISVIDCYEDEAKTKKIELTETGFNDIASGSRDPIRSAKCIRYCIMKKHNLFLDDYTLDESEVIPYFVYLFNNTIDNMLMKKIIAECNEAIANQTDRCERSHLANNCVVQRLKDSGMKDI